MANLWRVWRSASDRHAAALDTHAAVLRTSTDALKASADPPAYPSLDIVRSELDSEAGSLDRRASGIDTKAGQLLGFAGVLVGLVVNKGASSWIQAAGLILAVLAGLVAILVFVPRAGSAVNPQALREAYLTTPAETTQLVVLDTRIVLHQQDEQDLRKKRNRLFVAVGMLFLAIALVAAGPIMSVAKGGQDGGKSVSTPSTPPNPATTTGLRSSQSGRR